MYLGDRYDHPTEYASELQSGDKDNLSTSTSLQNSTTDLIKKNGEDDEDEEFDATPKFFDPIDLPKLTEEDKSVMKRFRVESSQVEMLRNILALYRGTHNWHNFVPGASHDDERCYMRIINMECSEPEVHFGMEWIRVKVHATALARFQFRRMISLAIMVIRTNTPRSVVGNSFGIHCISIPESPARGLIFDAPFYGKYNDGKSMADQVSFDIEKVR